MKNVPKAHISWSAKKREFYMGGFREDLGKEGERALMIPIFGFRDSLEAYICF